MWLTKLIGIFARPEPHGLPGLGVDDGRGLPRPVRDLDHLKARIVEAWAKMPMRFVNRIVDEFIPRLDAVIEAEGGHIQHLFLITGV